MFVILNVVIFSLRATTLIKYESESENDTLYMTDDDDDNDNNNNNMIELIRIDVVHTLAASYVAQSAVQAGKAAEIAA